MLDERGADPGQVEKQPAKQAKTTKAGTRRIAILSSAGGGGGGIAARRLGEALNGQKGADLTADFLTADSFGGFLPSEVAPMKSLSNRKQTDTHYTLEYPGYRRDWMVDHLAGYDLVNIHWASYLLSLAELDALARRGTGMLFMLHDFHYITGGCHYPAGCMKMTTGCLNCPQFDTAQGDPNVVPANLRIKQGIFAHSNVHLAAPSAYLRDAAVATGIVPAPRAHVLRNPYVPVTPGTAHTGDDTLRIVVIADSLNERRKGMARTIEALDSFARRLKRDRPDRRGLVHVIGRADDGLKRAMADCSLPHVLHGRIAEHARLVDIVAQCDIVLSCSFEDNWPNILVETGAYGVVPVVGPGHGCAEFSRVYGIGAVTPDYSADAFANALVTVMDDLPDPAARQAVAARIRADHTLQAVFDSFAGIAAQIDPRFSGMAHRD